MYPTTPANYPRGIIGGITFIPAMHFSVSAPATATAGTAFNFTVTALDASNNTMTGYTGTAHFASTDGAAVLPADATLTNGTGTFSATLTTSGNQTITATDTALAAMNGTSAPINVNALAATHFSVSTPANATAGASFSIAVTALDLFDNTDTAYAGTVHFTSTDGAAVLPADATLINGTGMFSATLKTAGSQTITATDTVTPSITATSASIDVNAGVATHFAVSAPPLVTTGIAFNFTITAQDQSNNTATGYSGTVQFTSSDVSAALPADSTLINGAGTFPATLATAGNQTITATDQSDSLVAGTSGSILTRTVSSVAVITDCQVTFVAGQDFTATAVVTGSSPTGAVDFLADGNYITGCTGVTLNSGSASCDTNALPIGEGALMAIYSGDAFNSANGSTGLDLTILDPADVVWRNSLEQVVAGCPME